MTDTTSTADDQLRRLAHALVDEAPDVVTLAHLAPSDPHLPDLPGPSAGSSNGAASWDRARPVHRVVVDLTTPGPGRDARRDQRRGRRAAAIGAVAAAVALGVIVTVAVTPSGDGGDDGTTTVLAADAGLEPAPQRLAIDGVTEVLHDGQVVDLQVDDLDGLSSAEPQIAFRADGSYVVVGFWAADPLPEDFNDLPSGLAVVGSSGDVEIERPIDHSRLLGVADGEAILFRRPVDASAQNITGPGRIIAHDLATGQERPLGPTDPDRSDEYRGAALVGDDLVTIAPVPTPHQDYPRPQLPTSPTDTAPPDDCVLRRLDLTTGNETDTPLELGCQARSMRVSPDGSQAAVTYETTRDVDHPQGPGLDARIAVVDLDNGNVIYDERVADVVDCAPTHVGCTPDVLAAPIRGMAWIDASTLRVAASDAQPVTTDTLTIGDIPIP